MRTPGVIIPSSYSSEEELMKDLKRRDEEAGFTPFGPDMFAHSDDVDDFLQHHGVKGMHWGVRRAQSASDPLTRGGRKLGTTVRKQIIERRDKRFAKRVGKFGRDPVALHNAVADRMNSGGIDRFNHNNKHLAAMEAARKAKDGKAYHAAFDRYLKAYDNAFQTEARSVLNEKFGISPSGKWETHLDTTTAPGNWIIRLREVNVKHADSQNGSQTDLPDLLFKIIFDKNQKIVSIQPYIVSNTKHSDDNIYDFLEHHGVKGMHWGVRHDPKRVGRTRSGKIKEQKKAHEGLSGTEKFLLIGAGVAAAGLLAYGTYKLTDSGKIRQLAVQGAAFVKATKWPDNFKLADPGASVEDIQKNVVAQINPNYGDKGTVNNCRRCTMAYEMRRRGVDVVATKTNTGASQLNTSIFNITHPGGEQLPVSRPGVFTKVVSEAVRTAKEHPGDKVALDATIGKFTSNWESQILPGEGLINPKRGLTRFDPPLKAEKIYAALKQMPDRARGELGIQWTPGGGHSVAWEIIDGNPVIFDTQTGHVMRNSAEFANEYGIGSVAQAGFTRLDNRQLNKEFLKRWLTSA